MALSVVRGAAPYWSLSAQSGHWQALARNASVENEPKLTLKIALLSSPIPHHALSVVR